MRFKRFHIAIHLSTSDIYWTSVRILFGVLALSVSAHKTISSFDNGKYERTRDRVRKKANAKCGTECARARETESAPTVKRRQRKIDQHLVVFNKWNTQEISAHSNLYSLICFVYCGDSLCYCGMTFSFIFGRIVGIYTRLDGLLRLLLLLSCLFHSKLFASFKFWFFFLSLSSTVVRIEMRIHAKPIDPAEFLEMKCKEKKRKKQTPSLLQNKEWKRDTHLNRKVCLVPLFRCGIVRLCLKPASQWWHIHCAIDMSIHALKPTDRPIESKDTILLRFIEWMAFIENGDDSNWEHIQLNIQRTSRQHRFNHHKT